MRTKLLLTLVLSIFAATAYSQDFFHNSPSHQMPPAVPSYVVFAGDTVRLDRSDLRERMDRELIAFTFSHTNSLLMLKRSERIFRQIVPILKLNGIPEDLKYLMAIESNLDPKALSSAGAAGLWQFMKTTAREMGLVVDNEVDERYNIEKETAVACKFLKDSYEKYGNWMTAAASYNAGKGGISKRLADQKETTALNLWMFEETSRYMFRILTAKLFFENPQAFGFRLEEFEKYPYLTPKEEVTVSGSIPSLVDFAKEHGVSYMQLKEANLWLRDSRLVNAAKRTYKIIIPSGE